LTALRMLKTALTNRESNGRALTAPNRRAWPRSSQREDRSNNLRTRALDLADKSWLKSRARSLPAAAGRPSLVEQAAAIREPATSPKAWAGDEGGHGGWQARAWAAKRSTARAAETRRRVNAPPVV
jgi:hypothetical protein